MATAKYYLDKDGLEVLVQQIKANFSPTGALHFVGTVSAVSDLPAPSTVGLGGIYMFTQEARTNSDFIEGSGQLINAYDEVAVKRWVDPENPEVSYLKWCVLGCVFDVNDKLSWGMAFPANPVANQVFLYLGEDTYTYNAVTPEGTENPVKKGWYEYDAVNDTYNLSVDTTVQSGTSYFERVEEYTKGVIYIYSGSAWVAQTNGIVLVPITAEEIEAMFEA